MLAITCDVRFDIRLFYHVIADKGRQGFHPQELVGLVEVQVNAVDADAVEELVRIGESLERGVPGQAQQVFFLNQAAGTVLLAGVGAGAAIVGVQAAVAGGEHFVDVFFRIHGSPIHQPGI